MIIKRVTTFTPPPQRFKIGSKMTQIALRQIGFHVITWASRNKDSYPRYFAAFALFVAGIVAASLILTAIHPAAGEIFQSYVIAAGMIVTLTGGAIACTLLVTLFIAVATNVTKLKSFEAKPKDHAPLPLPPPDGIAPDVLVTLREGETLDEFDARAEDAEKQSRATRWAVVIPYRSPVLTIFGDTAVTYNRDEPIFARPEWAETFDGRIANPGVVFSAETPEQYAEYCRKFVTAYREWAPRRKAELTAGRSSCMVLEVLKHSANILLLLLFSVAAFSQSKTEQVAEAVGTRIREIPSAGMDVSYTFETPGGGSKTYNRIGDGKTNIVNLLKKTPAFFNDEGGRLVAVTLDGEVVANGEQVERVNQSPSDQMRPYRAETPVMNKPAFAVPDSVDMEEYAERAKRSIDIGTRMIEQAALPWWEVLMYAFWQWSPGLILLVGSAWLWAKVGATEGFWNVHRYAKRVLIWITLCSATLIAINVYLYFVSLRTPPGALAIVAAIEFGIAYGILCWVNPDYRPKKGNDRAQPANEFFTKLNERN